MEVEACRIEFTNPIDTSSTAGQWGGQIALYAAHTDDRGNVASLNRRVIDGREHRGRARRQAVSGAAVYQVASGCTLDLCLGASRRSGPRIRLLASRHVRDVRARRIFSPSRPMKSTEQRAVTASFSRPTGRSFESQEPRHLGQLGCPLGPRIVDRGRQLEWKRGDFFSGETSFGHELSENVVALVGDPLLFVAHALTELITVTPREIKIRMGRQVHWGASTHNRRHIRESVVSIRQRS